MDSRVGRLEYVCDVDLAVADIAAPMLHDGADVTYCDRGADLGTGGLLKAAAKRAIEARNARIRSSPGPLSGPYRSRTTRAKLATVALAVLLGAVAKESAAANPADQRLACQEEARQRVTSPRRVDLDLYSRLLERRRVYVKECMTNGLRQRAQTDATFVPVSSKRDIAGT